MEVLCSRGQFVFSLHTFSTIYRPVSSLVETPNILNAQSEPVGIVVSSIP